MTLKPVALQPQMLQA